METGVSECPVIAFMLHLVKKGVASSPWPAAGSLSPVCHMPIWLSWNCHPVPRTPFLDDSACLEEDSRWSMWSSGDALCSCQGRVWGQTAAETSARPGEALRTSVSCPSSHLLTLLPTCGLSSIPPLQGAWLQTSEVTAKPEQGFFSTSLPESPQPLGTPSPRPTPGFSDGLSGDFLISPIFSLKYRSLLMRTHPLSQSFMCWTPEHSQSPAPWTTAPS